MKIYIGTKIIQAEPATEHDVIIETRGVTQTIGKRNRPGYKVIYPDGYISWSPKEVFKAAYREVSVEEKDLLESNRREIEEGG